jgi:hypothetical protein
MIIVSGKRKRLVQAAYVVAAILSSTLVQAQGAQPGQRSAAPTGAKPVPRRLLVSCEIAPDDAKLEVDGDAVHCSPKVPCATYLSPGLHKVVVVDPKDRYPRFENSAFNIAPDDPRIKVDLTSQLARLVVVSNRPVQASVDGEPFADGPRFELRPGTHQIEFRSRGDRCWIPQPASTRVTVEAATERPFTVEWVNREPEIIYIEPTLNVDGRQVVPRDAVVTIGDITQRPFDRGTGYQVGCGVNEIKVTRPAFLEARLPVPSADAAPFIGTGKPWKPELMPSYLTHRHVDCHEVTVGDFEAYVVAENPNPALKPRTNANTRSLMWGSAKQNRQRSRFPVNAISYDAAKKFCEWRAGKDEHARDAGVASMTDLREAANFGRHHIYPWASSDPPTCKRVQMHEQGRNGCGQEAPVPVCEKRDGKGPYGHCDLLGNVAEWVGPDPGKTDEAPHRVFGGGFRNAAGEESVLNIGVDAVLPDNDRSDNVGFRCAWTLADRETCSCGDVDHLGHGAKAP